MKHHLENSNSSLSSLVPQNLYIDNAMLTSINVTEALQWYLEVKQLFGDAKINTGEFASNSDAVRSEIPSEDRQEQTGRTDFQ